MPTYKKELEILFYEINKNYVYNFAWKWRYVRVKYQVFFFINSVAMCKCNVKK